MGTLRLQKKRIYDPPAKTDGLRVLADRLWPRGVAKADAQIDVWPKSLTPSSELRKWFHADPTRYDQFVPKYQAELDDQAADVDAFLSQYGQQTVTLLTAAKDLQQGHLSVLQAYLEQASAKRAATP
ncbi:DUF488 domain-containing protein [Blastopirellula marina]|uniref:DUF488 domain-containing protein n=2 Tax=Blastopirellula marina TaxID=124 RepID=A0A2S8FE10_9BACT|nr:DUF488 domain-containing protein [Blastopirellula marina]PQO43215.1 DUF488 domain-containing protein [Blastopirellula marina]PTL42602.1 DUF488 domain-containing protein [Blastopirellula marina]